MRSLQEADSCASFCFRHWPMRPAPGWTCGQNFATSSLQLGAANAFPVHIKLALKATALNAWLNDRSIFIPAPFQSSSQTATALAFSSFSMLCGLNMLLQLNELKSLG